MSTAKPKHPPTADQLPTFGLLTSRQAAAWLNISLRALADRADVPRLNLAAPGADRPMWRYHVADLEAFAAARVVPIYQPLRRAG